MASRSQRALSFAALAMAIVLLNLVRLLLGIGAYTYTYPDGCSTVDSNPTRTLEPASRRAAVALQV